MPDVKDELIEKIRACNDESFLQEMLELVQNIQPNSKDWWDELSNEQRTSVEEAFEQYKNGNGITNDAMQQKLEQWRRR